MPDTEHTWFLGLLDYEWEALSSISTGLAVVVAIGVPFLMRHLDRKEAARRKVDAERERAAALAAEAVHVAQACNEANHLLQEARVQFNTLRKVQPSRSPYGEQLLLAIRMKAVRRAEVLRTLAQQPRMNHQGISVTLGAARAMDTLGDIGKALPETNWNRFLQLMANFIEKAAREYNMVQLDIQDMLGQAGAGSLFLVEPAPESAWDGTE